MIAHRNEYHALDRPRGSALLLALVVSILLILTMAAIVSTTQSLGKHTRWRVEQTRALALAEGVTESAQRRMLVQVANFQPPDLSGTITINSTDYTYTAVPVGSSYTQTDPDGVQRNVQHYEVSATVQSGEGHATVARVIDLTTTPIFQYMIFYNDDLEILPGPDMLLAGRVHSGGDMYVGSRRTLTVDTEYFRCTGGILRKRKNDGSTTSGAIDIKVTSESTFVDMDSTHDATFPGWVNYALDTWKGTVKDGAHGVKAVAAPNVGSIKAFLPDSVTKGYYHDNADLVIINGTTVDANGNGVTLPAGTVQELTMYDGREGRYVTVTEVDIALLNASGEFPANGLIYAYRTDSTTTQPNGIRITNGAELLSPLTVVSEDPVYIHGDYNTVNKKGAAVISDAVNLLSSAWNDSKGPGDLPLAADTTYNLAFITGIVPTPNGGGDYSGGFENLPRFHEDWSDKSARIRGAFINIFASELATSPWRYGGDLYKAPLRDWQYDPALNDPNNLPPFTPDAVYFERVLWDDRIALPFAL